MTKIRKHPGRKTQRRPMQRLADTRNKIQDLKAPRICSSILLPRQYAWEWMINTLLRKNNHAVCENITKTSLKTRQQNTKCGWQTSCFAFCKEAVTFLVVNQSSSSVNEAGERCAHLAYTSWESAEPRTCHLKKWQLKATRRWNTKTSHKQEKKNKAESLPIHTYNSSAANKK